MQAVRGPAAGTVVPLAPACTVGRRELADPSVSRTHLAVSATPRAVRIEDIGSRNGTYRLVCGRWVRVRGVRRWSRRRWLALGDSVLALATRPLTVGLTLPPEPRPHLRSRLLAAPALLFVPLALWRLAPTLAPWVGGLIVAGCIGGAWLWWRRRPAPPSPAQVLLAAAAGPVPGATAGYVAAWLGRRRLAIGASERVCLVGPEAATCARWVAGQLAAAGVVRLDTPDGPLGIAECESCLALVPPTAEAPEGRVLTWAAAPTHAPAWATRLVLVPRNAPATSQAWWMELCTYLAATCAREGPAGLPEVVHADDYPTLMSPATDSSSLAEAWRGRTAPECPGDLVAWLGFGPEGPVHVDLVGDGPHAIVAGTTGSGKSEALLTWLLSLAWRYPPSALQMVLIDYKGGETFGVLQGLPHVSGVVSDLEPHATRRALVSLGAELTRREAARAAGHTPGARLLVVVDEFRRLAEDEPDLLDILLRIATIGRSLGVHVMLATQRPAGIVDQHMRANLPLRICLRVLEAADSLDMLGNSAAADLPRLPGRAVTPAGPTQIAWLGNDDEVAARVRAAASAWREVGGEQSTPPWAPPLPDVLPWGERHRFGDAPLTVGWRDVPTAQAIQPLALPTPLSLLVVGSPGSGRTTAARTCAGALATPDGPCHVVTHDPAAWVGAATILPLAETGVAWELLQAPLSGVLVIDGIDDLIADLDRALGPGSLGDRLACFARRVSPDTSLIVTGSPAVASARWAAAFRQRLVLPVRTALEIAHLGLTPADVRPADRPGRGLWIAEGDPACVHLALPGALTPPAQPTPFFHPSGPIRTGGPTTLAACMPTGDLLDLTDHPAWLVVGPGGHARAALADAIRARAAAAGLSVAPIDPESQLPSAGTMQPSLLVGEVSPSTLRHTYAGPLAQIRESAGVLALGGEDVWWSLLPPAKRALALVSHPEAWRALYLTGGSAHQVALHADLL